LGNFYFSTAPRNSAFGTIIYGRSTAAPQLAAISTPPNNRFSFGHRYFANVLLLDISRNRLFYTNLEKGLNSK